MIAIGCDSLRLSYGAETVLDEVTFSLGEGEKLGIVGVNGAGKSSLLKLLTGEYTPDQGNIFIAKEKTLGMLRQQPLSAAEDRSIWDEAIHCFSALAKQEEALEKLHLAAEAGDAAATSAYAERYEAFAKAGGTTYRSRCRAMLLRFAFPEEMWSLPTASLSGGQKTRLALATLLMGEPDILILDEPTNHLDADTLYWLEDYLVAYPKTVITVSHDRYFLDRVCTEILEIEYGRGKLYHGNYTAYVEKKKTDREIAERHYKDQQREIARIEAYIEQQRRWNRERNIIAAESREKQLAKMERCKKPEALPDAARMRFGESGESGNEVLWARGLRVGYPDKVLLRGADFLIKRQERVFLAGSNGCGKSTLLRVLAGCGTSLGGRLDLGYHVTIGYYDQENQRLHEEYTVLEEIWSSYPQLTQTEVRSALALFLFRGEDVMKTVSVLSGGERARLTLTKLMLSKVNLLILDEPTNHLDIPSREALEEALLQFDGTLVAVSHDRYFTSRLATRILAFTEEGPNGAVLRNFAGGFEEYQAWRKSEMQTDTNRGAPTEKSQTEAKTQFLQAKKIQSEQRRQETKIRRAKEAVGRLEAEISQIDERLAGEEAGNYQIVAELCARKDELEAQLLDAYETLDRAGLDLG